MAELERLSVESYRNIKRHPIVIVLDNVRSGLNVGSIFRTADAFGIAKMYCCGITSLPTHREVLKSALGSTETVEWEYVATTREIIMALKENGYLIAGVEQVHQSISLSDFEWDGVSPIALILGNEVDGVSDEVLDCCDVVLELAQVGTKHSINVAVCAGIVINHFAKGN
jgi:tRNA G18 (ribose-2'-O)-methylase SpoU